MPSATCRTPGLLVIMRPALPIRKRCRETSLRGELRTWIFEEGNGVGVVDLQRLLAALVQIIHYLNACCKNY